MKSKKSWIEQRNQAKLLCSCLKENSFMMLDDILFGLKDERTKLVQCLFCCDICSSTKIEYTKNKLSVTLNHMYASWDLEVWVKNMSVY